MKKINPLSLAVGAMFATTVLSPVAFAADNPFAMQKLSSGYQLAEADMTDKKMDGSCGEKMKDGSCGAEKKVTKKKDGKCGEGKCGANKKKVKEGSCGADKKKDGSCGADMKMDAPKAE
jgi:uncharacterized low-complexity protein